MFINRREIFSDWRLVYLTFTQSPLWQIDLLSVLSCTYKWTRLAALEMFFKCGRLSIQFKSNSKEKNKLKSMALFVHLMHVNMLVLMYFRRLYNVIRQVKMCFFCVAFRSRSGVFSLSSGRHPAAHVVSVGHPLLLHAHDAGPGQSGTYSTLFTCFTCCWTVFSRAVFGLIHCSSLKYQQLLCKWIIH